MNPGSLVPFDLGTNLPSRRSANDDPFFRLWRQVDSLFDDFFGRSPIARGNGSLGAAAVALPLELSETDDAYKIMAELPGVEEKDVDITLSDEVLTIKGEKRTSQERGDNGAFVSERSYGTFMRSIRLPHGVEADKVEAAFKNGVLTITLPKPAELQRNVRRIEVKAAV
jgi:HSP20 family protein